MVQRTEEQNCSYRLIRLAQRAGIAYPSVEAMIRLGRRSGICLFDQLRYRIDQLDVVAITGEPGGVRAGCTADVTEACG